LLPDGTIKSVGVRDGVTAVHGPYTITACEQTPPEVIPVVSILKVRLSNLRIDGVLASNEWEYQAFHSRKLDRNDAQQGWLDLPNGHVLFRYDRVRLYVMVNILNDNFDDPPDQGGLDNVSLLFDVDGDGQVTQGVDVRYRLDANTGNLLYQTFATPTNKLEFQAPAASTFSSRAKGFDCFTHDQSLFPSIPIEPPFSINCNRHRVWEFAIDRREIGADTIGAEIRMGIAIQSGSPVIDTQIPTDISVLSNYAKLKLWGDQESFLEIELVAEPLLEVSFTQGLESTSETIPVIRGKSAALRVMPIDATGDQIYRVAVYGQYQGKDLAGSPIIDTVRSSHFDSQPFLTVGTFIPIPDKWVLEGAIYQANTYEHSRKSLIIDLSGGVDSESPTYWLIPMVLPNVQGSVAPTAFNIKVQQKFVEDAFPVKNIDWVLRSEKTSQSTNSSELITELRKLYAGITLSWTFGLINSGVPPFALPDMIVGITNLRLCNGAVSPDCNKIGGSSSPTWWSSGLGRVAWGFDQRDSTLAHEMGHNLDRSATGSYGRHTPFGCGTRGTDPQWPYSNSEINAYGARIKNTWVKWINSNSPDFMAYCAGFRWISPYRWNHLSNEVFNAPTPVASLTTGQSATTLTDVVYISGSVGALGGGSLEPLVLQPGIVAEPMVSGQYTLRQLACDDTVLSETSFAATFEGIEGGTLNEMQFSFRLARSTDACALQLLHNDQLLAERRTSTNPPTVEITAPAGGVHWDGMSTISWTANDADGDSMQYMVFYSPDGGLTWVYLAGPISDTQLQIDSSILQGSTSAQVRVVATDGFNTSVMDTVDPFSVEASGPRTLITSHHNLQKVVVGQPVLLEGVGYDAMGQTLGGDAYRWFIDGEFEGISSELSTELELGVHLIEFFAVGADDLTGSDSIHLLVVPEEIFIDNFE
jgi:hypothetical protein